jgi:hypothetical protein
MRTGLWLLGLLCLATAAHAAEVPLIWDPVDDALSYDIEQSLILPHLAVESDWVLVKTVVKAVACTVVAPVSCGVNVEPPATGTAHYRFVAKNAAGRTVVTDMGVWKCVPCKKPSVIPSVGVRR